MGGQCACARIPGRRPPHGRLEPDALSRRAALGGELQPLGKDPGLAAVYDLAMLNIFFAGMAAYLHAAALVEADGITAAKFLPYARRILDLLGPTFGELAGDVDSGNHAGAQDNLHMESAFLDHIVATSRARGVDTTIPAHPVHSCKPRSPLGTARTASPE